MRLYGAQSRPQQKCGNEVRVKQYKCRSSTSFLTVGRNVETFSYHCKHESSFIELLVISWHVSGNNSHAITLDAFIGIP